MKPIIALIKKELRELFASPIAYVFISVFLLVSFWLFFSGVFLVGEASLRIFFGWIPVLFVVLLPAFTMGLWAEEKKTGTFELLLTLPAHDWQIVCGKLFSSVIFLLIVLLLTTPLVIIMSFLGDLDSGLIIGAYLGTLLLGCCYLALGLFISSLCKNQIVAFIMTVLVLFLFYVLAEPVVTSYLPGSVVPVIQYMSFNKHFASLLRGVIDTRDVVYFISSTALFVYLNIVALSFRKVS